MQYFQPLDAQGNPIGEPVLPLDGILPDEFTVLEVDDTTAQNVLQNAPVSIPENENAIISEGIQMLFVEQIFVDGILSVDGEMVEIP